MIFTSSFSLHAHICGFSVPQGPHVLLRYLINGSNPLCWLFLQNEFVQFLRLYSLNALQSDKDM